MSSQSFRIFRATGPDGFSVDTHAKFVFDPALESDELFDALRLSYPHLKTHAERKRQAVLDFLVQEREEDLRALDRMVSGESTSPVQSWSSARTHSVDQTPATVSFDSFSPTNTSANASPLAITPNFRASDSASTTSTNPAFHVWNSSSNRPVKLHKRRCMTDQEKEEYRQRRIIGSCDSCKQKRRKCRHYETAASQAAAKGRSGKRTKSSKTSASKTSPSAHASAASQATSTSSGSSPSDAATQSFNPSPAIHNNFPIDDFSLAFDSEMPGQLFTGDFSLFAEPTEPDFFNTTIDQPFHQTPDFFPAFDNTHNTPTDYAPNHFTRTYQSNTDWLAEPILDNFLDFSSAPSTSFSHSSNLQSTASSSLNRLELASTGRERHAPTPDRQLQSSVQESARSSPLSDGGIPLFDSNATLNPIQTSAESSVLSSYRDDGTAVQSGRLLRHNSLAQSTRSRNVSESGAVASGANAIFAGALLEEENANSRRSEERHKPTLNDRTGISINAVSARDQMSLRPLNMTRSSSAPSSLDSSLVDSTTNKSASSLLVTAAGLTSRASSSALVFTRPLSVPSETISGGSVRNLPETESSHQQGEREMRHNRHPLSTMSGPSKNVHGSTAPLSADTDTKSKPALPVPLPPTPPTPAVRPDVHLRCKEIESLRNGLARTPFTTSTGFTTSFMGISALSWYLFSFMQASACVQNMLSKMVAASAATSLDGKSSYMMSDHYGQHDSRSESFFRGYLMAQSLMVS